MSSDKGNDTKESISIGIIIRHSEDTQMNLM